MALISFQKVENGPDYQTYLWEGATSGDTFQSVRVDRRPWAAYFQITDADAWSASPSVAIHGSIDGTTFYALQNYANEAIAVTANGMVALSAAPLYIKPVLSSGDAGTDIDIRMMFWADGR